jgi:membrane protease YdiL (CAAX protease family)
MPLPYIEKESAPGGCPGALPGGDPEIYLRLPVAIFLLVGCMLLQVPIYLAGQHLLGKNLAVAAAMLLGMLLPAAAAMLWISPRPREAFRLHFISPNGIISVAGISLSFAFLAGGLFEWLLRSERLPQHLIELLEREEMVFQEIFRLQSPLDFLIVGAVLIILAPLAEELLFRGLLQGSLERTIGHWPGVLIAAISFGLLHGRIRFIPVTLLGLLMGYMVMRTNSLPVGMMAHSINNLTVLLLSQLFTRYSASPSLPLYIAIGGGIALVSFLDRFRSLTREHPRIPQRGSEHQFLHFSGA